MEGEARCILVNVVVKDLKTGAQPLKADFNHGDLGDGTIDDEGRSKMK